MNEPQSNTKWSSPELLDDLDADNATLKMWKSSAAKLAMVLLNFNRRSASREIGWRDGGEGVIPW